MKLPLSIGRLKHEGDCIVATVCDADGAGLFDVHGDVGLTCDDYPEPPLALEVIRAVNNFYPMLRAVKLLLDCPEVKDARDIALIAIANAEKP